MEETQSLNKAALKYIHSFLDRNGKNFPFHSYDYVLDTVNAFKEISKNSGLAKRDTEIARLVVAFKDVGVVNSEDLELDNQSIIDKFLSGIGLLPEDLERF